jgi:predicted XRE-type DNA-binding protein
MTMTDDIAIHDSSGNVFADLGIEDSEEYMAKSELAAEILRIVQRRRLTQAEAAKLLGIRQPKVSDLLRGRLDGFSTDRLLRFITRLGYDVQIRLSKARPHTQGRMEITAR